jgi:F0F1-type ATP synthase assembly protein I
VGLGTVISYFLIRNQVGALNQQQAMQLGLNFVFGMLIVVFIGILLRKKGDKM